MHVPGQGRLSRPVSRAGSTVDLPVLRHRGGAHVSVHAPHAADSVLCGSDAGSVAAPCPADASAALLQAVRTAAQRDLNRHMSTLATTYVRSLLGLPVMMVYLAVIVFMTGEGLPQLTAAFYAHALIGAMAQVVATALLISMFRLASFGVGTMLTKSDVLITAVMGAALFSV